MKIAVLVSGGVDSSVALKLLKDQGHDLTAFYLKIWLEDELSSLSTCPWEEDLVYVEDLCAKLNVPLKIISLQETYKKRIVSHTIAEVQAGRTPNPDILCNQFIKFGAFYDAIDPTFEKMATGHYAQVIEKQGQHHLLKSPDPIKDQTYFLCSLSQKQLARTLFPIGHLTKQEVRTIAKKSNLPTKDRKDSQGICFLGTFKFRDFLRQHLGTKRGKIVEYETKKELGFHEGHWFYTVGQRRDIRLSGGPWYIVAKAPDQNSIAVSNHYEKIETPRSSFAVANFNWLTGNKPQTSNLLVKIRHRSTPAPCTVTFENEQRARVTLDAKDQGIAAGQFAVFYHGNMCLGGGVIMQDHHSNDFS